MGRARGQTTAADAFGAVLGVRRGAGGGCGGVAAYHERLRDRAASAERPNADTLELSDGSMLRAARMCRTAIYRSRSGSERELTVYAELHYAPAQRIWVGSLLQFTTAPQRHRDHTFDIVASDHALQPVLDAANAALDAALKLDGGPFDVALDSLHGRHLSDRLLDRALDDPGAR